MKETYNMAHETTRDFVNWADVAENDFDAAVNNLLDGITADYVNWCNGNPIRMDELVVKPGRKFLKILRGGSVWGVVGKTNGVHKGIPYKAGDVFKAASWNAAAKHVRGNIFDEKDNWYRWTGPNYL